MATGPLSAIDTGKLIHDGTNPGKSVVIRPDPGTVTSPASLAVFPAPAGSPTKEATLLNVSGADENSEVLSITLDNPNPFSAPNGFPGVDILARPSARLEWGVNGVQSTAEVDFDHGLSLSIPCSFLRVTGVNDLIPPRTFNLIPVAGKDAFGRNIRLGAFCGYGSVSGTQNLAAKRTIYIDNLVQIGAFIKIPPFATNFVLYRFDQTAPLLLQVVDEGGVPCQSVTYPVGGGSENVTQLSGDAAFIIIPVLPPGVRVIRVIFGLAF